MLRCVTRGILRLRTQPALRRSGRRRAPPRGRRCGAEMAARRLWALLAALRAGWCLLPQAGYLHPDEFFQSPEVMAGNAAGGREGPRHAELVSSPRFRPQAAPGRVPSLRQRCPSGGAGRRVRTEGVLKDAGRCSGGGCAAQCRVVPRR